MNYIYIDLGSYDGDSVEKFMRRRSLPVAPHEFDIYMFEPNPLFLNQLKLLSQKYENIVALTQEAAWVSPGVATFAVDPTPTPMGSTLMPGKHHIWNLGKKIEVKTMDFSNWLRQFEGDYVAVKMDIEGAEFPILEKMIADGTDRIVKMLWLETHQDKVLNYSADYARQLINRLHCPVKEWK